MSHVAIIVDNTHLINHITTTTALSAIPSRVESVDQTLLTKGLAGETTISQRLQWKIAHLVTHGKNPRMKKLARLPRIALQKPRLKLLRLSLTRVL